MLHFSFNLSLGHCHNVSKTMETAKFIKAAEELLCLSLTERSASTRKNYLTAINSLKRFSSESGLQIMDNNSMLNYQKWLLQEGKNRNTASYYIRSLRSLYNMLYPEKAHPFADVFTGCTKTEKRAVPVDCMMRFVNFPPPLSSEHRLWYDIFMFSVLGMGIPFVDLAHLSKNNIHENILKYERRKTSQLITVPIVCEMREILERYEGRTSNGKLFPLFETEEPSYSEYQNILARYNRGLRKLSQKYNLPCMLTSYVARHTWASLANASGVNLKHISQALGHSSVKTTEIYLACLSSSVLQRDSLLVAKMLYGRHT